LSHRPGPLLMRHSESGYERDAPGATDKAPPSDGLSRAFLSLVTQSSRNPSAYLSVSPPMKELAVMRRLDVSGAWRAASPRHRRVHLRRDRVEIPLLFLRLVSVGLLSALGWVHLHLWQAGYRHIPTIGPLFLLAALGTVTIAVALLVWPSRFVGLLGFGTVMGILAGLIVSTNVGLFGFTESSSAPFAVESIVLEMAAAITLAGWVAVDLMMESRQTDRAVRVASHPSASTRGHTGPSTGSPRRRARRRPAAT
jgi:hypothetical protein